MVANYNPHATPGAVEHSGPTSGFPLLGSMVDGDGGVGGIDSYSVYSVQYMLYWLG